MDAPTTAGADVGDFNAIAWAQFQLRGGWRTFWSTTLGYTVLVGAGIILLTRLSASSPGAAAGSKLALTALQAGVLVLFSCGRVAAAIRQDLTSRMIESHRLMPISPAQAVVGYMTGPAAQPLGLAAANLFLGVWLSASLGTPVALWLTVNAVLVLFAAFAVTLAAFGALAGKPGNAALGWVGVMLSLLNIGSIGAILPGLTVLGTPFLGPTVFSLGVAGADAVSLYAMPTVFQLWIGGVCFAAACRRYRRDDRPALGWDLGLALLAGWVVTSVFAIVHWEDFRPIMSRGLSHRSAEQFLGSTFAAMLLGLAPLAGSAWSAADWAGRRYLGDPSLGRRPVAPVVVAFAATALTLLVAAAAVFAGAAENPLDSVLRSAVILAAYFVASLYILRVLVRVTARLMYPLLLWVGVTWLLPLLIDYCRWWINDGASERVLAEVAASSPMGALIEVWTYPPGGTTAGIVFQVVLAAAAAVAYFVTQRRWEGKPAPARA